MIPRSAWLRYALWSLATGSRLAAQQTDTAAIPRIGERLPAWRPGTLDIHQLAMGRGNAALLILPDSTTLLIDAGAAGDGIAETDPHPDASRSPGAWIARYVQRHAPTADGALDYALITHFHPDHFGHAGGTPLDPSGTYHLSGITEVGTLLPIRTLIDRGWPDYSYPAPLTDSSVASYRRFLDLQRHRGLTVERLRVGAADQIRLRRHPEVYPAFEIRNIIANGEVWAGSGSASLPLFPALSSIPRADWPSENMCSLGIRLTFGAFRYFTGGDLPGTPDPGFPVWHGVEAAVASAVGPVTVQVVNQHGSMGEASEPFLRTLAAPVLIIPSWAPSHPAPDVLKRLVNSRLPPARRWIYVTDLRPSARTVIGPRSQAVAGPPGHIVVRVDQGGSRYWVIVVDNTDESDRVLDLDGPFTTLGSGSSSDSAR